MMTPISQRLFLVNAVFLSLLRPAHGLLPVVLGVADKRNDGWITGLPSRVMFWTPHNAFPADPFKMLLQQVEDHFVLSGILIDDDKDLRTTEKAAKSIADMEGYDWIAFARIRSIETKPHIYESGNTARKEAKVLHSSIPTRTGKMVNILLVFVILNQMLGANRLTTSIGWCLKRRH